MRVTADDRIVGYRALQIRRLMRETVGRSITPRYVREILNCTNSAAARVLGRLEKAGFLKSVRGYWEATTKGSALAMATAAPPLRRQTAERLVAELVDRARLMNADDRWAYRVHVLVLFGSYARGAERPSDVDIGCELRPRWSDEKQRRKEQESRDEREGRFRNISEWAMWPKLEVIRYLRARARGLSIHELEDWIKAREHRVIFEDAAASERFVFPSSTGHREQNMLLKCKAIAERAGLDSEKFDLKTFRSTFATRMLRSGFDVRTVQHWMGHKSLETTMRYLVPARDVHDRLDQIVVPSVARHPDPPRKSVWHGVLARRPVGSHN